MGVLDSVTENLLKNIIKCFFGRSFRHVNQNDVVCQIPAPIKYRHVGQEIYFDEEGIRYFDSGTLAKNL